MERVYLVTLAKETESRLAREATRSARPEKKEKEKEKGERRRRKEGREERSEKTKKPVAVKVDPTAFRIGSSGWRSRRAITQDIRLVDDRIFYLRRTVGDDRGEDEEEATREQK